MASCRRKHFTADEVLDIIMQDSDSDAPTCDSESSEDERSNLSEVDIPSVSDIDKDTDDSSDAHSVSMVTATQQKKYSGREIRGCGVDHGIRAKGRGRGRGRGQKTQAIQSHAATPASAPATGDFKWEALDEQEYFEQNWLAPYQEKHGVLVDASRFDMVDYFYTFFPQEAFSVIAEETNRYAQHFFDSHRAHELPPKSPFRKWTDTDSSEIHAFVALQIAMGIINKPTEAE